MNKITKSLALGAAAAQLTFFSACVAVEEDDRASVDSVSRTVESQTSTYATPTTPLGVGGYQESSTTRTTTIQD